MTVGSPTRNRVLLPVSGSVEEFERVFRTSLGIYRALGQDLLAPRSGLKVPRWLSRKVRGTIGVPELPVKQQLAGTEGGVGSVPAACIGPDGGDPGPPPLGCAYAANQPPNLCSRFWAAKTGLGLPPAYGQAPLLSVCGYGASQIRSAYGGRKLYRRGIDGSGVDIGIVTAYLSPTLQSDLDAYSDQNQIPRTRLRVSRPSRYSPSDEPAEVWPFYTEQTLDVQVSHGMAPGARINYSGPDGTGGQIPAVTRMVDRNRVDVISNSWATPEIFISKAYFVAAEAAFVQAAAQGITMLYGSGDTGDNIAEVGIRTVEYPASSRWVTAVGGTTLSVGPTGARVWEQAWGESATVLDQAVDPPAWDPGPAGNYIGGSTGGTSRVFPEPDYQRRIVPKRFSSYFGGRARVVPDVALMADLMSGPGLVQTAVNPASGARVLTRHSVGGTSVATPVFAGVVALVADRNGGRLGFLNPSLYRAGGKAVRRVGPAGNAAVSAMVSFNNFLDASGGVSVQLLTGGEYGTLTVRRGYDDVTGLGSPSARLLAKRLRQMSD